MLCGGGGHLARNAAEALADQLLQRPARAVAREHAEVVDVDVRAAVRLCDLVVIDLGEPVVCRNRARVAEDQTADRVGDGGVLLDAPVGDLDIAVHQFLVVEDRGLHVAQLLALAAVEDVRLGNLGVAALDQHRLDAVLDVLNGDQAVLDFRLEIRGDAEREKVDDARMKIDLASLKCHLNGVRDLGQVKINNFVVSLFYMIHKSRPPVMHLHCIFAVSAISIPQIKRLVNVQKAQYFDSFFDTRHYILCIDASLTHAAPCSGQTVGRAPACRQASPHPG